MTSVRELLREIEELKCRQRVWMGVREYLEGFTPEGGTGADVVIDGAYVPQDTVLDVINEVESTCLDPIAKRIKEIEAAKVDDGKARVEAPAKKSRKRSQKKS